MSTQRIGILLLVGVAAVGLTGVFWLPLWQGGGFIGGDIYTYYLPQKVYYAEHLQAGELPLWNNRTGHGYPLIAESQTGALYPFHLLLYGTLDVNTAYHVNHLLHYILAFVFTGMYARRFGLTVGGALLAAVVFTYGWFPPRSCLEWAIITGAYLPLALWCVESFLQTRLWRYLITLSIALGLQMLAGHYNLAFITQLLLVIYTSARLWMFTEAVPEAIRNLRVKCLIAVAISMVFGFGLAAVQVLPTWELKQISQRAAVGPQHDPGYGHIPPFYWSQIVAPWMWYGSAIDLDAELAGLQRFSISSATNKVEAHLYFGLVPLLLISVHLATIRTRSSKVGSNQTLWLILALMALIYTSGHLLPVTKYLPGFNFFMGPGRFGIVTTLGAALLAGSIFGVWLQRLHGRRLAAAILIGFVFAATTADLWLVSRLVTYAQMLHEPPIKQQANSEVSRILAASPTPVRLYAPGPNLPTLTGFASTPPYLGIGPSAYYDPKLKMPEPGQTSDSLRYEPATAELIAWLQRAGVTHVLSHQPLDPQDWPDRPIWQGYDRLLNPAWARYTEPLYLSELQGSRGRVSWADPQPAKSARITEYKADRVTIEVGSPQGGKVLLTDLYYPGWTVTVDGEPAEALEFEGMYRAVEVSPGDHTIVWKYEPRSVYWGAVMSILAAFVLAAVAHVRFWHPDRLRYLNEDQEP